MTQVSKPTKGLQGGLMLVPAWGHSKTEYHVAYKDMIGRFSFWGSHGFGYVHAAITYTEEQGNSVIAAFNTNLCCPKCAGACG